MSQSYCRTDGKMELLVLTTAGKKCYSGGLEELAVNSIATSITVGYRVWMQTFMRTWGSTSHYLRALCMLGVLSGRSSA